MAGVSSVRCPHCRRTNRVPAVAPGRPKCGNCHQLLPWIVTAGDQDFADIAGKVDVFVLIDLWATWCRPCQMVSPALERLATEFAGRIKLVKVDVDSSPAVAARFEVRAVPTLLVMRGGDVVARQAGAPPMSELRHWLTSAIGADTAASV
ncbi:MAG TPA: thioredoxin [Pseudonocardiaceae bacterium]|nr:thioredoxin [Pseudonocardiaceae bacterium]